MIRTLVARSTGSAPVRVAQLKPIIHSRTICRTGNHATPYNSRLTFATPAPFTSHSSTTSSRCFHSQTICLSNAASSAAAASGSGVTTDSISQLPSYTQLTPARLQTQSIALFTELDQEFNKLEKELDTKSKTGRISYSDVIPPIESITDRLAYVWGVVQHLSGVKDTPELRAMIDEVEPKRLELALKFGQSKEVVKALKVLQSAPKAPLTDVQKKIVSDMLLEARLAGVELEGDARVRFNNLSQRLAKLSTQFSHNVLDATKNFGVTILDKAVVEGIPENVKSMYALNARETSPSIPTATTEEGPWRVGLSAAHLMPFLTHSPSREHRQLLHRAFLSRASIYDGFDNAPVLAEIIAVRHSIARMLGFETYAHQSLATKLVKKPEEVKQFLEELRVIARPHAESDMNDLQQFAYEQGFPKNHTLKQYDLAFYADKMEKLKYSFDGELLRPYLPFPKVLQGLWKLCEEMFEIKIQEHDPLEVGPNKKIDSWHPDVKYFDVYKSGALIAGFFVDAYSRPSEKRGGAWMGECIGRAVLLDGTIRKPVAYLICNQQPPVGDKPSLMSFDELTTLFHEFGHVSQHIFTTVNESSVAGIRAVEWDAVELASQFLENFCYEQDTLTNLSAHIDTKLPIPSEMYQALIRTKNFRSGTALLRQLHFSMLDMALHSSLLAGLPTDHETADVSSAQLSRLSSSIASLESQLSPLTSLLPYDPSNKFLNSFSHLFAGGYAAGYYSYKWSEVMSCDAFEAFEEVKSSSPATSATARAARSELGRKYRDAVLALGGSKPAAEVFRMFRGRDPSIQPLLKQAGLISVNTHKQSNKYLTQAGPGVRTIHTDPRDSSTGGPTTSPESKRSKWRFVRVIFYVLITIPIGGGMILCSLPDDQLHSFMAWFQVLVSTCYVSYLTVRSLIDPNYLGGVEVVEAYRSALKWVKISTEWNRRYDAHHAEMVHRTTLTRPLIQQLLELNLEGREITRHLIEAEHIVAERHPEPNERHQFKRMIEHEDHGRTQSRY